MPFRKVSAFPQPWGLVGRNLQRDSCVVMNWLGKLHAVPLPSAGWHVRRTDIYSRDLFIGWSILLWCFFYFFLNKSGPKDLLDLTLKKHLGDSLTSVLSLSLVCDHCWFWTAPANTTESTPILLSSYIGGLYIVYLYSWSFFVGWNLYHLCVSVEAEVYR